MKKLLFFSAGIFFLILLTENACAYPILQCEKSGKGPKGYNYVEQSLVSVSDEAFGWVLKCKDAGYIKCEIEYDDGKGDNSGFGPDKRDARVCEALMRRADRKIKCSKTSGTKQRTVRVFGENFKRVYTITWSTSADGIITQDIDRNDI